MLGRLANFCETIDKYLFHTPNRGVEPAYLDIACDFPGAKHFPNPNAIYATPPKVLFTFRNKLYRCLPLPKYDIQFAVLAKYCIDNIQ